MLPRWRQAGQAPNANPSKLAGQEDERKSSTTGGRDIGLHMGEERSWHEESGYYYTSPTHHSTALL